MRDTMFFIEVAQRNGISAQSARAVLDALIQQLHVRRLHLAGFHPSTFRLAPFYVYRTTTTTPSAGGNGAPGRTRLLVAFPSADAALAFAQQNHLGATPRLLSISVARLLAILVQRTAMSAILFADEPTEPFPIGLLPHGLRLERTTLMDMLKEE